MFIDMTDAFLALFALAAAGYIAWTFGQAAANVFLIISYLVLGGRERSRGTREGGCSCGKKNCKEAEGPTWEGIGTAGITVPGEEATEPDPDRRPPIFRS